MSEVLAVVPFIGSTKQAIYDAYQDALKRLNDHSVVTTTATVAKKEKETTIKSSDSIVGDISTISTKVTAAIAALVSLSEDYNTITNGIRLKQEEIKSIHDFEVEANSTIALVAAKNQLLESKNSEAENIIKNANQKATDIISAANDHRVTIELENNRKKAEYEYEFRRKEKADTDALQDKLDLRIREMDEREKLLAEREKVANEKDAKIVELTHQVEVKEAETLAKVNQAIEEAKKKAETSAAIARSYLEKEHKSEIVVKEAKIESLTEKVTDLQRQIDKSAELVASANKNVAEMAMGALKAQADAATVARVSEVAAGAGNKR